MAVRSKLIVGNLSAAPKTPQVFFPYGDHDDPLRLTVLLAEHVGRLFPKSREIQDATTVCLTPRASWSARHAALRGALVRASQLATGHFIALSDIDVLVPRGRERWDDDRSTQHREQLFNTLRDSIDSGGWLVIRPDPGERGSYELANINVDFTPIDGDIDGEIDELRAFSPACRPIASWLVREGHLRPADLSRIVATVKDRNAYVQRVAFDAIAPDAFDAGKLLSALRAPQALNGSFGRLEFVDDAPVSAVSAPRAAVTELAASGLLQPAPDAKLKMPLSVRDLLQSHAWLGMAEQVRRLHLRLGAEPIDAQTTDQQLETHHHAVRAGDVDRAKSTARFYGAELRDMARRLSIEAGQSNDRAKFEEAAALFAFVIEHFDEQDPYAWEYLGYNLARADAVAHGDRILDAYERAHELWRDNPLYHGRLLGFRGQLGHDITSEVTQWLGRSAAERRETMVSFFAEAVFQGLRRGNQPQQTAKILQIWRPFLERFAPRVLLQRPDLTVAGTGDRPSITDVKLDSDDDGLGEG